MVVPARPLGIRHLTDDEVTRGDLVADVFEQPLACVFLSFASRLGHRYLSSDGAASVAVRTYVRDRGGSHSTPASAE